MRFRRGALIGSATPSSPAGLPSIRNEHDRLAFLPELVPHSS